MHDENTEIDPQVDEDNPAIAVDHEGNDISVLSLLDEMKKEFRPFQLQTLPRAELQERYIHGEQNIELGLTNEVQEMGWGGDLPNVTRNHLRSLALTYASRIMEDRPIVKAWPADPQRVDMVQADAANAIIEYHRQRQDIDAMMERAAILAQAHGSVAFKVCWDKRRGPLEWYNGKPQRMGDVLIEMKTVFDYIVDPVEHIQDAKWVAFRTYLDKEDARGRVAASGGDINLVESKEPEYSVWSVRKEGVETWEIWHLPCKRFPNGLYAVVTGGVVTTADSYPYNHQELPLSVWKIQSRRDHPHGTTHVTDALPLQRSINEGLSVAQKLKRDVGDYVKLIVPASIAEDLSPSNQVFAVSSAEQASVFNWVQPPIQAINHIYENVERDERALFQVFGLNEMLTGKETAKASHSGKAIAYMKQLDSQKLAHSARNLGECNRRMWRQLLELYKQFVHETRMQAIMGENGEVKQVAFNRTTLDGVDIVLDPHAGSEDFRASKAEKVEQDAAAGYIPPHKAMEMRETGLDSVFEDTLSQDAIERQIDAVLSGQIVQADQSINPTVAQQELQLAMELYQDRGPQIMQPLYMLYLHYGQVAKQSQQMAQQGQRPKPQNARQQPIARGGVTQ